MNINIIYLYLRNIKIYANEKVIVSNLNMPDVLSGIIF